MNSWAVAAVFAIVLAGCTKPTIDADDTQPCSFTRIEDFCVNAFEHDLHLDACKEARSSFYVDHLEYDLPGGFTNAALAPGTQVLAVSFHRCESLRWADVREDDVSFLQVGVFANPPQGANGTTNDIFILEQGGNSPALRAYLNATGIASIEASVELDEQEVMLVAHASGEIDYLFETQFAPVNGGPQLPVTDGHHSEVAWYREIRSCSQRPGFAPAELTANAGILTRARSAAGPLPGLQGQAVSCDLILSLEAR